MGRPTKTCAECQKRKPIHAKNFVELGAGAWAFDLVVGPVTIHRWRYFESTPKRRARIVSPKSFGGGKYWDLCIFKGAHVKLLISTIKNQFDSGTAHCKGDPKPQRNTGRDAADIDYMEQYLADNPE